MSFEPAASARFPAARRDRGGQAHGAATILAVAVLVRTGHAVRNAGVRVPDDARFCLHNPLHGIVGRAGPRPMCGPCAERVRDFRGTETLLFLRVAPPRGELTPYYRLPGLFHPHGLSLGVALTSAERCRQVRGAASSDGAGRPFTCETDRF